MDITRVSTTTFPLVKLSLDDALAAIEYLDEQGENARLIGHIEPASGAPEVRLGK